MGHLAVQQPGYLGGVEHQDQLVRRAGFHPARASAPPERGYLHGPFVSQTLTGPLRRLIGKILLIFHTGVLAAPATADSQDSSSDTADSTTAQPGDPEPAGVHHYPTPIVDIQPFKYDDF